MNWFTRLCRNAGLTIHHVIEPIKKSRHQVVIDKEIKECRVSDNVTLRRTTIDEIEVTESSKKGEEAD